MCQTFVEDKIPSFMSVENARLMFETGKSLRYLERYHPNHPLVVRRGTEAGVKRPKLEWKFSWEDLERYVMYCDAIPRY